MNRHDIVNNTLRLEVLGKVVIEAIEKENNINQNTINDYIQTLESQINLLKEATIATEG
jgi:predicted transcriptional regulator